MRQPGQSAAVVIGARGLAGTAISRALGNEARAARIDWRNETSAITDLRRVLETQLASTEPRETSIFWAAGRAVISSETAIIETESRTFSAVQRLLRSLPVRGVRFVLISSAGALHRNAGHSPISESTPPDPPSQYGRMKLQQEQDLAETCAQSGLAGIVLRVPTLYGLGQDRRKGQGLITALVDSSYRRSLARVFVPRDSRRHYLWSDDLGMMARRVVDELPLEDGDTFVRHVYSERSRSVDEVVETVTHVTRRRPVVSFMATNHSDEHGRDLSLTTEHPAPWKMEVTVGLADGVRRIAMGGPPIPRGEATAR